MTFTVTVLAWIEGYSDYHLHLGLKIRSPCKFVAVRTATARLSGDTQAEIFQSDHELAAGSLGRDPADFVYEINERSQLGSSLRCFFAFSAFTGLAAP